MAAHLLVVEGQEEQDTVSDSPEMNIRLVEAAKERTLNSRRSSTGGRRAPKACHAYAPNSARPQAGGQMTMVWLKPPWMPTSVSP